MDWLSSGEGGKGFVPHLRSPVVNGEAGAPRGDEQPDRVVAVGEVGHGLGDAGRLVRDHGPARDGPPAATAGRAALLVGKDLEQQARGGVGRGILRRRRGDYEDAYLDGVFVVARSHILFFFSLLFFKKKKRKEKILLFLKNEEGRGERLA